MAVTAQAQTPTTLDREQTAEALEQCAQGLKRGIAASRRALQAVRQAQVVLAASAQERVELMGIEVETITEHDQGVHSANEDSQAVHR